MVGPSSVTTVWEGRDGDSEGIIDAIDQEIMVTVVSELANAVESHYADRRVQTALKLKRLSLIRHLAPASSRIR